MLEINNLTKFRIDKKSFSHIAKIVLSGENRLTETISFFPLIISIPFIVLILPTFEATGKIQTCFPPQYGSTQFLMLKDPNSFVRE